MSALTRAGIDHLSFSSLNAFSGFGSCELAWFFDRIEKRPRRPAGPGMFVGKAWDAACETAAKHKLLTGADPEPDLAAEAFLDAARVEERDGDYDLSSSAEREEETRRGKQRGPEAARKFAADTMPQIRPKETQRRVEVAFDEVDWTLVGYVDLVEAAAGAELPGVIVTDHKATLSSSRKFDQEKAQSDLQLGLYDLALSLEGERVEGRGFRSCRLLKTKTELGSAFVPSTQQQRDASLGLLAAMSARIESACESGNFLPTAALSGSWKCASRWCDHFDHCPHGRRAQTVVGFTVRGEAA